MAQSIFAGVETARTNNQSVYIRPGHYIVRVNTCKLGQNRKKQGFAAIEMTVVHVYDDNDGKGHRVGDDVTHLTKQDSDYFLSEIKTFISKVLNMDPASITQEECEQVFSDAQPFRGFVVEVKPFNWVTQQGTDFTKMVYVREVPPAEALKILTPESVNRFFPNNILQGLATALAAQQAAQPEAQQAQQAPFQS